MLASLFTSFLDAFSDGIAIDLGTATTLAWLRGRGVVCQAPSVVAVRHDRRGVRHVLAVGEEARRMLGRTPADVEAIRPLRDGVIADFEITEVLLRHVLAEACGTARIVRPRVVVCIPYGTTEVEKRAVRESAERAGAREVHLVEEPLAAAIGADLPVDEPAGNMVVDIGGGTTEVAVISCSGIVHSRSVRVGGDRMDEAIVEHVRERHELLLGAPTAEQVKIRLGSAVPLGAEESLRVRGRDLRTGFPREVELRSGEVREALRPAVEEIVRAVVGALERTPPELAADIVDRGLVMTGGGALLRGLDRALRDATGLPVLLADDPLTAVVRGSGRALEELGALVGEAAA